MGVIGFAEFITGGVPVVEDAIFFTGTRRPGYHEW